MAAGDIYKVIKGDSGMTGEKIERLTAIQTSLSVQTCKCEAIAENTGCVWTPRVWAGVWGDRSDSRRDMYSHIPVTTHKGKESKI